MTKIDFKKAKHPNYGSTNTTPSGDVVLQVKVDELDESEIKAERGSLFLGFYVVLYALFLVSAAAIFMALEAPKETEIRGNLLKMRQAFLSRFPSVKGKCYIL